MDDITIWKDARLDLQVSTEDDDAVSATISLSTIHDGDTEATTYEFTKPFVDKVADFQSETGISLLPAGVYSYMIFENYDEGLPSAYPDPDNCDGDCDLPTLTICEAIEVS